MKLKKLWESFKVRLVCTSRTIVRHIERVWRERSSVSRVKREVHAGSLARPKPKIYTFASRTRCKFLLPEFFPCLAKLPDNLFFGHSGKRRGFSCDALLQFLQESFSFFGFMFYHCSSPPLQVYYEGPNVSITKTGDSRLFAVFCLDPFNSLASLGRSGSTLSAVEGLTFS